MDIILYTVSLILYVVSLPALYIRYIYNVVGHGGQQMLYNMVVCVLIKHDTTCMHLQVVK